jgi:predicted GIY-YIG superfamily endonuclease
MTLSEQSESKSPTNMEKWYVYICRTSADHYYVGISPNPIARLSRHNSGNGSKMARDQGKFELLYISSPFPDKSTARKREIQVKGWTRAKKEKLIAGTWQ